MPVPLQALLIVNFVVEAFSGLFLMIMPGQTAAVLYPNLESNALAVKFARTTGTAIFVLGLLSILPLIKRFTPSVPLLLVIFSGKTGVGICAVAFNPRKVASPSIAGKYR